MTSCSDIIIITMIIVSSSSSSNISISIITSINISIISTIVLHFSICVCVSSLRRNHANILCVVPSLTDDPRRESGKDGKLLHALWHDTVNFQTKNL